MSGIKRHKRHKWHSDRRAGEGQSWPRILSLKVVQVVEVVEVVRRHKGGSRWDWQMGGWQRVCVGVWGCGGMGVTNGVAAVVGVAESGETSLLARRAVAERWTGCGWKK